MPWKPEDWERWLPADELRPTDPAVPPQLFRAIVRRIPDRRGKAVVHLGCGMNAQLSFLASHFGRVVVVDGAPANLVAARGRSEGLGIRFRRLDLRDLTPLRESFDVAVAIDGIPAPWRAEVGLPLEQIHGSLVEGGILIATFPAVSRRANPYSLFPRPAAEADAPRLLHEVELQYLLRRAGFRGLRIGRVPSLAGRSDTLLCTAARRANN